MLFTSINIHNVNSVKVTRQGAAGDSTTLTLKFEDARGDDAEVTLFIPMRLARYARELAEAINAVNADPKIETFPSEAA